MKAAITQLNTTPQTNFCSQCRISHLCLPGTIQKTLLREAIDLNFHAKLLEPGEHLCHQGESHDHLYLLRSGLLKSYFNKEQGDELIMDFHLPPELFGWEGIDEKQLSFSIVALDFSNVCEISLQKLKEISNKHPEIQIQLLNMINRKIRINNTNMMRTTAEQRVSTFILALSEHYKSLGYPHYLCKLGMTHQDIANYLRIAPETISRILHSMQKRGIITVYRKKIYINNFDQLQQVAEGIKLKSA